MGEVSRKEHVFREILGGVAVLAVVSLGGYFAGAGAWLASALAWLGDTVEVSRWWYGTLLVHFILTVLIGGFVLLRAASRPEHHEYREDWFFGMVWRWEWGWGGEAVNLWCWCPRCDRRMVYSIDSSLLRPPTTTFVCQSCESPIQRLGFSDQTLNDVLREIELKIRKGEWRDVVATYQKRRG